MKAIKISAALLGLAVAGWCAIAPGIVGMRYEEKCAVTLPHEQQGGRLHAQPATVRPRLVHLHRQVQLKLPIGGQVQVMQLDYKIKQLPLPFMRWSRTDISFTPLDEQGKPGLPLPLTLESIRKTDGSNDSHLPAMTSSSTMRPAPFTFSIDGKPTPGTESRSATTSHCPPSAFRQPAVAAMAWCAPE
jgi:hypothetical protein